MKITNETARRFILNKQGLMGEMRYEGTDGVTAYCKQAGCIQFDPVDACGRNADLVLQSRVKDYRKDLLTQALYEKRDLVDYWDKNMAIIPKEDWPFFAPTRAYYASAEIRSCDMINEHAPHVLKLIGEKGPCFSDDLCMKDKIDWYWSSTTLARAVLEALYFRGELGIHHKRGTQKCYDLIENLIPKDIFKKELSLTAEQRLQMHIKRRIGAVGMLWDKPSDALLCVDGHKNGNRTKAFQALEASGDIIKLEVEGIKDALYILNIDQPLLEKPEQMPRTEFIAPLDAMMWDRKLIKALFHFDYTWEIYTPKEKRKYGYYVLPILQGDALVGRIEMEAAYKDKLLRVKNIWTEKGIKCDKRAVRKRVKAFAAFAQAKDIVYET